MRLELDMSIQKKVSTDIKADKGVSKKETISVIWDSMDIYRSRLLDCTIEKGSSSWLTALPLYDNSYYLNKGEFWMQSLCDIALRWKLPNSCACGKTFNFNMR